jgi:acylglycerol lipase
MTTAAHEQGAFTGAGNRRIVWRAWGPAVSPAAVVTIAHGYGEHIGRYAQVAGELTTGGYQVYGLDHHGHGGSEGKPGQVSLADAIADLDQLITTVARARHPDIPQFLLGHSMGGAIALRYAALHQDRLDGLLVSAPLAAVSDGPLMQRVAKLLGVTVPSLPVTRVSPKLVSRDPQVVDAYQGDPRNYHGMISARVAREFVRHTESLPAEVRRITLPTLLIWGTADRLCPVEGAEMVAREIGSRDLTVKQYEGLYHEIMNEPERETVIDDVLAWLKAHS